MRYEKNMEQYVLLHLEVPEMRACAVYRKTGKKGKNPTFRHALKYWFSIILAHTEAFSLTQAK